MKQSISLLLVFMLLFTMVEHVWAEDASYGDAVTEFKAGEHTILVYYPTPNIAETSTVKTTCTAPILLVYGEGSFTKESAIAYANETGLAQVAAENGASVCFVNPINGESWTDVDVDAYGAFASLISDSSTDSSINGVVETTNFMTGETEQKVVGIQQRTYMYGINAGADFVANNYLKKVEAPSPWGGTFDATIAGCTLVNLTDASGVENNDVPVASIGNSDAVNALLEEKCGSVMVYGDIDYRKSYADITGQYRRQSGVLLPMIDYAAEGITETISSKTVSTSKDNPNKEYQASGEHEVNYVVYHATDMDMSGGDVPLVIIFHGGGNTALYFALASEWPLIAKENNLIVVSIDAHMNTTATETVDLIEMLKADYPIDKTRIYATGFSMGSTKSWDLAEQYPEAFAGFAPMSASFAPAEDVNQDLITPVFALGGELSFAPEVPFFTPDMVERVRSVFKINNIVKSYDDITFDGQDAWEDPIWGVHGDIEYIVVEKDNPFQGFQLEVELYQSEDGKYYTALAYALGMGHETFAANSWAAWDFLSQFSRAADGTIVIEPVTYSLPAEDANIRDNSYNQ